MMKYIVLVSMCMLSMAQFDDGQTGDWSQLGHDIHHTYSTESSVSKYLEIKWQYQTKLSLGSSPAVVGDRVYIFGHRTLYCVNLQTGELLYEVPAYSKCPSTPTVAEGKIYLAADQDQFQCRDAHTEDILWEKELPALHWMNPLVDDTTLYVTVDNLPYFNSDCIPILYCGMTPEWLTLLALDKETGEEIWRYSVIDDSLFGTAGMGFPILVDGTTLFHVNYYEDEQSYHANLEKSDLVCLDALTGFPLWKHEGVLPSSPTELDSITPAWITYYESMLYMSFKGYVMAVDAETKNPLWEYKLAKGWDALFSVGHGVVVAKGEGWVYCLDAETGRELWMILVDGGLTMPAMTKDAVFVGSDDGNLYRIGIKSGEITESYYLGGFVFSPIVANKHVLVGTSENRIYCLGPSSFYRNMIGIMIVAVIVSVLLLFLRKTRAGT